MLAAEPPGKTAVRALRIRKRALADVSVPLHFVVGILRCHLYLPLPRQYSKNLDRAEHRHKALFQLKRVGASAGEMLAAGIQVRNDDTKNCGKVKKTNWPITLNAQILKNVSQCSASHTQMQ